MLDANGSRMSHKVDVSRGCTEAAHFLCHELFVDEELPSLLVNN